MKIVRPLRFDQVRRAARNKKRRDRRRAIDHDRKRLQRAINGMFWFGVEPSIMWDNSPWDDRDPSGGATAHNDNLLPPAPR